MADSRGIRDPYERVLFLEKALAQDIEDPRLIPYIQLHEFEALILSEPARLLSEFPMRHDAVNALEGILREHGSNAELVNDGQETAPSKRIMRVIPEYEGSKASAGPLVASAIGLDGLRHRCRHFAHWLKQLENLGGAAF